MAETPTPFLTRVRLRNYKSIRECDVELGPLMFLVGVNGSGKSNFLDALRLVTESLRTTMDQALRERGGVREVRRRSRGHPTHFVIELFLALPGGGEAAYRFRVGAKKQGGFEIQEEDCRIAAEGGRGAEYQIRNGKVRKTTLAAPPPASTDRLYLTIASGLPEFRPLYDMLSGMGFYNINPERLRELQDPAAENLLLRDGCNTASVIDSLQPFVKERIEQYLGVIAPGVKKVSKNSLGPKETLEFKQTVAGDEEPWSFWAQNMSDGTLRALGVLVSLFQCFDRPPQSPIPLVAIEEPEATVHPAAAGVLLDALRECSHYTQVLVTSHSPELMDSKDIDPDSLLIVESQKGETIIGPADNVSKLSMRKQLFTAGELLALNQLKPEPRPILPPTSDTSANGLELFPDFQ